MSRTTNVVDFPVRPEKSGGRQTSGGAPDRIDGIARQIINRVVALQLAAMDAGRDDVSRVADELLRHAKYLRGHR